MQNKISGMQRLNITFHRFIFLKLHCVQELLFLNATNFVRWLTILRSIRSIHLLSYDSMF